MNRLITSARAGEARKAAAEWAAPFLGKSEMVVIAATRADDEFVRPLPGARYAESRIEYK